MHSHAAVASALEAADRDLVYLLHANADPDCVGAAYALARHFGGVAWAVKGVSAAGRRLVRRLDFDVHAEVDDPARFKLRVAVDASTPTQFPDAHRHLTRSLPYVVVDHHASGTLPENAVAVALETTRSSACEVALGVLDAAKREVDERTALALLAGHVADTGRFRYADSASLAAGSRLLEASGLATIEDVLPAIEDEDDEDVSGVERSRRLAHLKAASRVEVHEAGARVIATSRVASYEASAANALAQLGADVAFVAAERKDGVRVSARARRDVILAGLHLGEIMLEVAEELGCGGGGHAASAGMNGAPSAQAALEQLVAHARRRLADTPPGGGA